MNAIPVIQNRPLPLVIPTNAPSIRNVIKEVAIKIFQDMALALSLAVITACFVQTGGGILLLKKAFMVQVAVSALFHSIQGFLAYKIFNESSYQNLYQKLHPLCEWGAAYNFAVLSGFNTFITAHEIGHAIGSWLVYKHASPNITIYPFRGGFTLFNRMSLSAFGKTLGKVGSVFFTTILGPALSLLISSSLLTIGISLFKTNRQLSKYLISCSSIDFLNHANYAYSALRTNPSDLSHDFVRLWQLGLHPIVSFSFIVAIPILIGFGLDFIRFCTPQQSMTNNEGFLD